jgi:replication factor C subunit 3/5
MSLKDKMNNKYIPFVEKYRPTQFEDVILDDINKTILNNIIETSYFPNLIFYGFPGCGKTTAIINLIKAYQIKNNQNHNELIIHLNASDDRGIDIIRTQIYNFVISKSMFLNGMKFVILDECDYMTKNAQQALKYLLQNYYKNVRFCLICNYISKIDEGLKNEFVCLRFNQLNKEKIIDFLDNINNNENLNFNKETLYIIQKKFNYDIRSMINFMQSKHKEIVNSNELFIDNTIFDDLFNKIKKCVFLKEEKKKICLNKIIENIENLSLKFCIDKKCLLNDFINFLILKNLNTPFLNSGFLNIVNNTIHIQDCKIEYNIGYFIINFIHFIENIENIENIEKKIV